MAAVARCAGSAPGYRVRLDRELLAGWQPPPAKGWEVEPLPPAAVQSRNMESATAVQTAPSTSTLESFNPATGELVGSVPTIVPEEVQGVVDDVARIQPAWAELPAKTRADYMRRAADALLDDIDEIAELLTTEQGKPRNESYTMELLPTVDALHWCAKAGPKILADEKVPMTQAFTLSKKG